MSPPALPAPAVEAQLGSHLDATGVAFALWAPRATRVELALVDADRTTQHNVEMTAGVDGVWYTHVEGAVEGTLYGYRVHGDWNPEAGERFNPAKLLLDPYARAYTGGVDYAGPIMDHTAESNYLPDPADSFGAVPLSVVVAPTDPPPPIVRRSMAQSVIYELHVKGYTRLHPQVPEHQRGTYSGLAHPAVIEHLLATGVTAVELLPIHHFVSEPFVVGAGLSNYWGYNSLGFFAPHEMYGSVRTPGGQVAEFKQMVTALHEAGIEVILDVVYNHSGEGGHEGPTLSFRGIDHSGYYRLTDDNRNDYDVTGCGNSIDTSQPGVQRLILDSLRYWVNEMGVDGFRFDLATTLIRDGAHHVDQQHPLKLAILADPDLAGVKLIAEPWDIGPYGYQMGHWGPGWSEWNDRYRGYFRDYWRDVPHGVQELATRLSGSPDIFNHGERAPGASVNFITAHDGFTMRDLVSYDHKHNDANREHNRDGTDDNRSWNCGVEGDTDDPTVLALRRRQIKNLLGTLIFSHGTPMIVAGDEFGRTQQGNNNAYCQDGPISWVDWASVDEFADIHAFTSRALSLRAEHPVLRPEIYQTHRHATGPDGSALPQRELAWLNGSSGEMSAEDWHDPQRDALGMYVFDGVQAFVIWLHAGHQPIELTLPPQPWGTAYRLVLHSGDDEEFPDPETVLAPGTVLPVAARSFLVFSVDV